MNETLEQRVKNLLASLPADVRLVAAAKTRRPEEVGAAIRAGVTAIGENYVQEAEAMRRGLAERDEWVSDDVRWHLIGHLQRNKAKKAVALFDMIETIDSVAVAEAVDRHCGATGKTMPVLLEVNSGRESNKTGIPPEDVESVMSQVAALSHIRIQGLMTMGPRFGDPEKARPYFRLTKELFDRFSGIGPQNTEMRYLSMGMSNSYEIAIEEGANIVRVGTKLFGARKGN